MARSTALRRGRVAHALVVYLAYEIYVMNAEGSDPANLTRDPGYDGQPAWR